MTIEILNIQFIDLATQLIQQRKADKLTCGNITVYRVTDNHIRVDIKVGGAE